MPQHHSTRLFDIFENSADCFDVVKKIGELHQIDIVNCSRGAKCQHIGWKWSHIMSDTFGDTFETYEEAVASVCLGLEEWD